MSKIKTGKQPKQNGDSITDSLQEFIQSKKKQIDALKKVIKELDRKDKDVFNP